MTMNDDDFAELFKQLKSGQSTGATWQDVRNELESLGRTLGDAFRLAPTLKQLREMLEMATLDWNSAVDGTPEAQRAREQFMRVTESLNDAMERAGEQVRPELVRLLRDANAEIRRRSGLSSSEESGE